MWLNSHDPKWLNFKRPLTTLVRIIKYNAYMAFAYMPALSENRCSVSI